MYLSIRHRKEMPITKSTFLSIKLYKSCFFSFTTSWLVAIISNVYFSYMVCKQPWRFTQDFEYVFYYFVYLANVSLLRNEHRKANISFWIMKLSAILNPAIEKIMVSKEKYRLAFLSCLNLTGKWSLHYFVSFA